MFKFLKEKLKGAISKISRKIGEEKLSEEPIKEKPIVVNIGLLEKKFKEGDKITPKTLLEAGIIGFSKGKMPKVKLLGSGVVAKKLLVSECQISKQAKEKIVKAGGEVSGASI